MIQSGLLMSDLIGSGSEFIGCDFAKIVTFFMVLSF